jgi:hypothetical protein
MACPIELSRKFGKHQVPGWWITLWPSPNKGRNETKAEKSNNPAITNLTIFSFGNILYLIGCDVAMYLSIAITEIIKHVVRPLNIYMNEIKSHIGCPPTHCNLLI